MSSLAQICSVSAQLWVSAFDLTPPPTTHSRRWSCFRPMRQAGKIDCRENFIKSVHWLMIISIINVIQPRLLLVMETFLRFIHWLLKKIADGFLVAGMYDDHLWSKILPSPPNYLGNKLFEGHSVPFHLAEKSRNKSEKKIVVKLGKSHINYWS